MSYLLYLALPIIVQALLIIHVIKTGRNTIWIWVIALLSVAGIIAYVVVELLPEVLRSRTLQATGRSVKRALDPEAQLRRLQDEAQVTQNVASSQRYAEELLRHERFQEAASIYRRILSGLYAHDPDLMLGLARAQFGGGDASAARATLDEANPARIRTTAHPRATCSMRVHWKQKAMRKKHCRSTRCCHVLPGAEAAVRLRIC